jgi:hypothetical protein
MVDNLARLTRDWLTKAVHDLQNARIVSATPAAGELLAGLRG